MMEQKLYDIVITSGGFDPLHNGHVEYLKKAKELTKKGVGIHICIVNNDNFLRMKKGYKVLSAEQRLEVVKSIRYVDNALIAIDKDYSVSETIKIVVTTCKILYKEKNLRIAFVNGGDVTDETVREKGTCNKLGIDVICNLGKKIESSSNMIERVK